MFMNSLEIEVFGDYAFFKKPETNNCPLSFPIMHKVSAIGLLGAICGIERQDMRNLYPTFCDEILFGIKPINCIVKEPHGFSSRKVVPENFLEQCRKSMELLRSPKYRIILSFSELVKDIEYNGKNVYSLLIENLKNEKAIYPPNLGRNEFPASVSFIDEFSLIKKNGLFETKYITSFKNKIVEVSDENTIIAESLPTFQTNDWYNPISRYEKFFIEMNGRSVKYEGEYYSNEKEEICLH